MEDFLVIWTLKLQAWQRELQQFKMDIKLMELVEILQDALMNRQNEEGCLY